MSYLLERRRRLTAIMSDTPIILANGWERLRNPSNTFNFRGESHVIYFADKLPAGAILTIHGDDVRIYLEPISIDEAVWTGSGIPWNTLAREHCATVHPLSELKGYVEEVGRERWASLPVQDPRGLSFLRDILGRIPDIGTNSLDRQLAKAIVEVRLIADERAQQELRDIGRLTVKAHLAGMAATRVGGDELDVYSAMMGVLMPLGATTSFAPIISMECERLHQPHIGATLREGALLLVDFGAESGNCWAGDITNTWPISGKFTSKQRAIYEIVLEAHRQCVAMLRAGVRYLEVHMKAVRTIAEGLKRLGILRGDIGELIDNDAHSLFFPHGIGHLLGLDVHDMEDLGDIAGYQEGRVRSKRFGLNCLRLDRDLRPGMALTIEPGIYFIPELLDNGEIRAKYENFIDWDRVEFYRDVRGVRIERDYLITEDGYELLTPGLPDDPEDIEKAVGR